VVLELDAVRQAKGVERDDEGRYFIPSATHPTR
jgi:hypothetical protein